MKKKQKFHLSAVPLTVHCSFLEDAHVNRCSPCMIMPNWLFSSFEDKLEISAAATLDSLYSGSLATSESACL